MKHGEGELVSSHHLFGVLFRVNGERHDLGPELVEVLDVFLKVSQLLMAEASPLPPVEEHDTPAPIQVSGDRLLSTLDSWGNEIWQCLFVFQAHVCSPIFEVARH